MGLCSVSDVRVLTGINVVMLGCEINGSLTILNDEFTCNVLVADPKLIYGTFFTTASLLMLTVLQVVYMVALGKWSDEIFMVIIALINFLIGVFFGEKWKGKNSINNKLCRENI